MCAAFFSLGRVGKPEDLDDAGIADTVLNTEGIAHGAGDDLKLGLILGGKCHEHHEEADKQAHQIGEGDKPPVTTAVTCFLDASPSDALQSAALGGHRFRRIIRFFFAVAMLFGQIGKQHLAHESRALAFADHQNAVDDQGTVDFLIDQFEV